MRRGLYISLTAHLDAVTLIEATAKRMSLQPVFNAFSKRPATATVRNPSIPVHAVRSTPHFLKLPDLSHGTTIRCTTNLFTSSSATNSQSQHGFFSVD